MRDDFENDFVREDDQLDPGLFFLSWVVFVYL